nr:MAG TPA: hypothetical protein [Caudoviricetes sp.]
MNGDDTCRKLHPLLNLQTAPYLFLLRTRI